jgi:hypothetical protein
MKGLRWEALSSRGQLKSPAMTERKQYAAIEDLEAALLAASKDGGRAVALIFLPGVGWQATDQVQYREARPGEGAGSATVALYSDWFRDSIGEAVGHLHAARFIPGQLIAKLFRKAISLPLNRMKTE